MMRSLYSGVAGLKTHQVKMDVIGNNIANVNTTAFKSSSITFSELMSQTTQSASGPNAATGTGGVNAKQIGLGVKAGAINVNIATQGASQSTGNPFDIMISGSNFFVVNNGSGNYFTRDGSFYVDGGGNLAMTSTGYNVMGWGVDPETNDIKKDTVSALRIMNTANMTYPPEATTKGYVSGILDKNDKNVTSAAGKSVNLNFFDSLGYSYTAKFVFKQSDDVNHYSVELDKLLDATGKEVDISGVEFGDKGASQQKERKVSFNTTAYAWDGKVLTSLDKTKVYADVSQMFDANGVKTGEYTVNETILTVEESLNNIAKAYGYEGATEEFLNLYNTDADNTQIDILQMLSNLALGNPEDANVFPTFATNAVRQEVDLSKVEFEKLGEGEQESSKVNIDGATYTWDGKVLMSLDKSKVYADISQMFDENGLKTGEYTVDGTTLTVEESLNNIAKAYGYDSATEEFKKLVYSDADGNQVDILQMFSNLSNPTSDKPGSVGNGTFTVEGRKYNGSSIMFDSSSGTFAGINGNELQKNVLLKFVSPADDPDKYSNFSDIEIDFSECSMFDNKGTSTIGATSGDLEGLGTGRRLGDMIGVSVQSNGMIYASYDNGMTKLLGQIATAEFANPSGLEKTGDNLYASNLNSGEFDGIGTDVTANGGYMSTGQLEMSNVDLSAEFTEMITTQRGFQANSRIITVSDTLLEELTNLKR